MMEDAAISDCMFTEREVNSGSAPGGYQCSYVTYKKRMKGNPHYYRYQARSRLRTRKKNVQKYSAETGVNFNTTLYCLYLSKDSGNCKAVRVLFRETRG
jgi:hypothetical protein